MPNNDDFDAVVRARTALLEQARKVLPAEQKLDGLTEREVHELVLRTVYGDKLGELGDKSDAYVRGRWQHAIEAGRLDAAPSGTPPARDAATPAARTFTPDWLRQCTFTRENVSQPTIQRGGVARDKNGSRLADWAQPLSYSVRPQWRALPPKGN